MRWLAGFGRAGFGRAGFGRAEAGAGAEVSVEVVIPLRSLGYWDTDSGAWVIEPGEYLLRVGRSSRDLRLTVPVMPA